MSNPEQAPTRARAFPEPRWLRDPHEPFLVPLTLLLATRAFFWRALPNASEDAYITFRYARHLVSGLGLTFNSGERVMGISSPLWTLWSALGIALVRNPVAWARGSSLAADVTTLIVMGGLIRRHASRASAWCFAAFFACWTYFAAVAMSGMEASVLVALTGLSAALIEARSPAAGVSLGALAFARPEGLLAAAVLALRARWRDRAVLAAIVAAGLLALESYFGAIVPQGVIAKRIAYGIPGPIAGTPWWEWISPFVPGRWPVTNEGSQLFAMAIVTGPAAAMGAAALWKARATALASAAAAMLVVWLGYALLGVPYFFWYLATPLAGVMVAAAVGLPRIVSGRAVYAGLLAFVLGTWTFVPGLYLGRAQAESLGFGGIASYLEAHARPGQSVALEPIGLVGWRCDLRIVDETGLISPRVCALRARGDGWMSGLVQAEDPDWIVLRRRELEGGPAFAGAGLPFRSQAERDEALRRYRIATVVQEDAGDAAYMILARLP